MSDLNKKVNDEMMQKPVTSKKSNSPMEVMNKIDKGPEPGSKQFFSFPKTIALDEVKNYGEFPLRTYEMLRNNFVGSR
jgi:hypothetical protein